MAARLPGETIYKEIRYALRMLGKSPGFTAVAVLTLALGIGANTAMFSVIRAVMLKPLPFHQPENLYRISTRTSYPDLQDLGENSRTIAGIAGYHEVLVDLTTGEVPERISAAVATGDLFQLLGVSARKGRLISRKDDVSGGAKIVVLSDRFWKTYLGSDPDVIGKSVSLAGQPYTVIGVLPAHFEIPQEKALLFLPLRGESKEEAAARGAHTLRTVVRLPSGTTREQAQSDFDGIAKQLEKHYPEENLGRRFLLVPWEEFLVADVRRALLLLLAAVGFVLLIACTNVANLFLSRAADREKEMAVRAALGAGRWSLLRQLMVEGIVLAVIAGGFGLVIGAWISELAVRLGPENIPRLGNTRLDVAVLAATLGLSVFTGLLFSLAPGLYVSSQNLENSLKETGRSSAGPLRKRLRNLFVIAEIAVAIVLLVGAGLLIRSFWLLHEVDPGFRSDHLLTWNFTLPTATHADITKRTQFFQQVLERVRDLPGVVSVGSTTELPFGTGALFYNFAVEGRTVALGTEPEVYSRGVSPDYLRSLGIPMIQGRSFDSRDTADSLPVAIANQKLVRQFFPGENPIGKRVCWAREEPRVWMTIVGVVSDVRSLGLDLEEEPALYSPFAQERRWWKTWMNLVVRTSGNPASLAASIHKELASIDKNVPVADLLTMDTLIANSVGERRFHLLLLALFAGLALVLAAVGIYGIFSYNVGQRTQEIGIRVALGATTNGILNSILNQGIRLAIAGSLIGVVAALSVTRFMRSLLFAIGPMDWPTFLVVPLIVIAVALLACYAPARRATRVDPIIALRYE